MKIVLKYKDCAYCPFLSTASPYTVGPYYCAAINKWLSLVEVSQFVQPDWCPLLVGDIVVTQPGKCPE